MATAGRGWPPWATTAIWWAARSPTSTSARPSEYEATLDQERLFDDLPTDDGQLPFVLTGTVR